MNILNSIRKGKINDIIKNCCCKSSHSTIAMIKSFLFPCFMILSLFPLCAALKHQNSLKLPWRKKCNDLFNHINTLVKKIHLPGGISRPNAISLNINEVKDEAASWDLMIVALAAAAISWAIKKYHSHADTSE